MLSNVIKLLKAGIFADSTFIFTIACWITAIFSTKIDLSFRLFSLNCHFKCFQHFIVISQILKKKVLQRTQEVNGCVTIHEEQYCSLIEHSCGHRSCTKFFIRTDGLGTHLVENQIGIARQNGNDPRRLKILAAFAHACLHKKIAIKYDLSLHIQERINDGGV